MSVKMVGETRRPCLDLQDLCRKGSLAGLGSHVTAEQWVTMWQVSHRQMRGRKFQQKHLVTESSTRAEPPLCGVQRVKTAGVGYEGQQGGSRLRKAIEKLMTIPSVCQLWEIRCRLPHFFRHTHTHDPTVSSHPISKIQEHTCSSDQRDSCDQDEVFRATQLYSQYGRMYSMSNYWRV